MVVLPTRKHYVLRNATVPTGCLEGVDTSRLRACVDHLALVDIEVKQVRSANMAETFPKKA